MAPRTKTQPAETSIATTTPAAPAPTAISLDLRKQSTITLMPLDVRRRAQQLTADAAAIVTIGSTPALETADALASRLKAAENEIAENIKAQLAPIKDLIKAIEAEIACVTGPMTAAREALTVLVCKAKDALGYEESTSCYTQERDDIQVKDISKVPLTVKWVDKAGKTCTETLLKVDTAAVARVIKGSGMTPAGIYVDSKIVYGTKST